MAKRKKATHKKSQKGGNFLNDLQKGLKEADKFLKKTQVISKGLTAASDPSGKLLAMIPHPAAQIGSLIAPGALKTAGSIANSYGYGRRPTPRRLIKV
jgi:hypothetical protein